MQKNPKIQSEEKKAISPMLASMSVKTKFNLEEVATINEQIDQRLVLPLESLDQTTKIQWLKAIIVSP